MYGYLIRRFLTVLLLMWVMTVIIFGLASISGGGVDRLFPVNAVTPFDIVRHKGINETDTSPAQQYFTWLKNVFWGNFGNIASFRGDTVFDSVSEKLIPMFNASLLLVGTALLFLVILGFLLGTFAAVKPDHIATKIINFFCMVNTSIPDFAIAIILMMVFAVRLRLLPSSGMSDPLLYESNFWQHFLDRLRHLILPAITLSFTYVASFTEHVRKTISGILQQDYIRTARAKGLSGRIVLSKHALRNGLVPCLAAVFASLPFLMGGIVMVEYIFAWPGIGLYIYRNISSRGDFHIVLMITGVTSMFSLLGSLIADFLYALADPRITSPVEQKARIRIWPFSMLIVGGIVPVVLYRVYLYRIYENIGSLSWILAGMGACLLGVSIPLQLKYARRKKDNNLLKNGLISAAAVPAAKSHSWLRLNFNLRLPGKNQVASFFSRLMKPSIIIGLLVIWALVLGSFYPVFLGFQKAEDMPLQIGNMLKAPSWQYPFGTDGYGRNYLLVILLLGRQTLGIAFGVSLISTILGTAIGVLCGFLQGVFDRVVSGILDLVSSIPSYFFIFLIIGLTGSSTSMIMVLSIFGVAELCRVVRAQVLAIRNFLFVEAAEAMGNSAVQIIVRHLLPNLLSLVWGQSMILVGRTMLLLCSLGYLNILSFPTWGSLVAESVKSSQYLSSWWTSIFPIAMIFVAVSAVYSVGKGVLRSFDPFAR